MSQIPLLILGDAPSLTTGLARIGRDIATQLTRMPQFRVAYLGRGNGAHIGGGIADARLPFMQYTYQPTAENQWGARELPDVWRNWANGQRGVIFTIWDPSRLTWFGNPQEEMVNFGYSDLHRFLTSDQFERWGYFAVDAEGPGEGGALTPMLADTLAGYDRVLAYSKFGKRVIEASLRQTIGTATENEGLRLDWLPHGYNASVFQPRDRMEARFALACSLRTYTKAGGELATNHSAPLVGCVMANQPRKDWGLWARTMQLVAREIPSLVLWAHTDSIDRHWDLRILLDTFGLADRTIVTVDQPSDTEMSWRYSACDLTVLPSLGEGFGYPIVESQACGVAAIHGNYAAGVELLPDGSPYVINPKVLTLDTRYCMMRPVFEPEEWATAAVYLLQRIAQNGTPPPSSAHMRYVEHLRWPELWPRVWQPWFEAGAQRFAERAG